MIRIQSGGDRGRYLKSPPKGVYVRPILARVKKSLFDILRPRLQGTTFLDLYAGTGAVGFEALSNGAKRATFVELDRRCQETIRKNAELMGYGSRVSVESGDASKDLRWLSGERFDLVFMGPPYRTEDRTALALTAPTLARLLEADILAANALVVCQRHKKEPLEGLSPRWEMLRENRYGDSVLSFFRLRP